MTNCAGTARGPDEQRLVDIASILAAGILRLRDRQSLTANSPIDVFENPKAAAIPVLHPLTILPESRS